MYKTSAKKALWNATVSANNTVGHSSSDEYYYLEPPPFKDSKPIIRKARKVEVCDEIIEAKSKKKKDQTLKGDKINSNKKPNSKKKPFNGLFSEEIAAALKEKFK